jgi:predicted ATP-grasp superfamily ATP-dependent carboligase
MTEAPTSGRFHAPAAAGPSSALHATPRSLLILGASTRAWASSTRRLGLEIHAVDLFADRDLLDIATATPVAPGQFPAALESAAATFPTGPWCYTGALENHPDVLDAIAAHRPLLGNGGDAVRTARSPRRLAAVFADRGIVFPRTVDTPSAVPTDGSWLRKPLASAGGLGIAPWTGHADGRTTDRAMVWQERHAGLPVAGVFVVIPGAARFVGASRQVLGVESWHARPFAYCGSIDVDPATLPAPLRDQWQRVGNALADDLGLRGVVGVDAIVAPDGRLVVIEINPRPSASMELVDRRTGRPLAADHLGAYGIVSRGGTPSPGGGRWAKGVLRTRSPLAVDDAMNERLDRLASQWTGADGWPAIADLPRSGTFLPAGAPCVTLFAVSDTGRKARRILDDRIAIVDRLFTG